ncbi:MAG: SprT-like domain-containing protein [Actinomycetota bacterium]
MSIDQRILEVPNPELVDLDFLHDVFSHQEFYEVRTIVAIDNLELTHKLLELGFSKARAFSKGKKRFQRLRQNRFDFIEVLAIQQLIQHGLEADWAFSFDSAKQRAGLCNYSDKMISISKYFVQIHSVDQAIQVILHEIAHALAGKSAGHGPAWKSVAKSIGYRAEKFTGNEIAEATARWVGECRNGHKHYRYKSPRVQLACGYCGKGFNPKHLIVWTDRAA